jgi:hypothetical protein
MIGVSRWQAAGLSICAMELAQAVTGNTEAAHSAINTPASTFDLRSMLCPSDFDAQFFG